MTNAYIYHFEEAPGRPVPGPARSTRTARYTIPVSSHVEFSLLNCTANYINYNYDLDASRQL